MNNLLSIQHDLLKFYHGDNKDILKCVNCSLFAGIEPIRQCLTCCKPICGVCMKNPNKDKCQQCALLHSPALPEKWLTNMLEKSKFGCVNGCKKDHINLEHLIYHVNNTCANRI